MRSNQLSYPAIASKAGAKVILFFIPAKFFGRRSHLLCKNRHFFRAPQRRGIAFAMGPVVKPIRITMSHNHVSERDPRRHPHPHNRPRRTEHPEHSDRTDRADRSDRPTQPDRPAPLHYPALEIVKVLAGLVLLAALSWEILAGDHIHFSRTYLWIQFAVCLVFLCDFFVRWGLAKSRRHFFWVHLPYLLLAIPWLNILDWCRVGLTHDWGLLVGLIPMLRAFLAMVLVVEWLVSRTDHLGRIFWAYIFTVVVFTYLSGLVFYDYEIGVNPKLNGFGNALWWAWMNVTTVGAQIFAVTGIGKIVTVLLPSLGMMFFPIFTTYILDRYTGKKVTF